MRDPPLRHTDRLIGCRDLAGRRRTVIVVGDRRGTVLITPPGEVAVLATAEVDALRGALGDELVGQQRVTVRGVAHTEHIEQER